MGNSAADGAHGFPAVVTSFIGRAGPVDEVARLVGRHRLVTVTGPGGTGKTRLASEVARRSAAGFADGAWLVELASVQNSALVPSVVAVVLGGTGAAWCPGGRSGDAGAGRPAAAAGAG